MPSRGFNGLMENANQNAMTELDYLDPNLHSSATEIFEKGEALRIRVRRKSAEAVKKAILLDTKYFALRQRGKNDRILLAKFGWYAIRTPFLWGVLNKARLMNLDIATTEENGELLLTINKPA